jgi:hypothetical protein
MMLGGAALLIFLTKLGRNLGLITAQAATLGSMVKNLGKFAAALGLITGAEMIEKQGAKNQNKDAQGIATRVGTHAIAQGGRGAAVGLYGGTLGAAFTGGVGFMQGLVDSIMKETNGGRLLVEGLLNNIVGNQGSQNVVINATINAPNADGREIYEIFTNGEIGRAIAQNQTNWSGHI